MLYFVLEIMPIFYGYQMLVMKSLYPKYDPKTYFNKSIEEVGRLLSVNPFRLQTILNNRNKLGIESTKHILSAEEKVYVKTHLQNFISSR